ncbi:MAG: hypothetical protein KGZ25_15325 [Planctomycetes bacterium]|nr:hypothetical protein [Planctomycetota bacterium]
MIPAAAIIAFFLVLHPLSETLARTISPLKREELRPVLKKVSEHKESDSPFYVYYGTERAFQYYQPRYMTE